MTLTQQLSEPPKTQTNGGGGSKNGSAVIGENTPVRFSFAWMLSVAAVSLTAGLFLWAYAYGDRFVSKEVLDAKLAPIIESQKTLQGDLKEVRSSLQALQVELARSSK